MCSVQSKAEEYLTALESLPAEEKKAVLSRLLEDEDVRRDLYDILLFEQRVKEKPRPFDEYLSEKQQRDS